MIYEKLTQKIIECSMRVHTELGPGLFEKTYQECLYFELLSEGIEVQKELVLPVFYKEIKIDLGYRIDLLVEKNVIVELKSVQNLNDIHLSQILTYLKLSGCKIGLLMNFNVTSLKLGLKRVINKSNIITKELIPPSIFQSQKT